MARIDNNWTSWVIIWDLQFYMVLFKTRYDPKWKYPAQPTSQEFMQWKFQSESVADNMFSLIACTVTGIIIMHGQRAVHSSNSNKGQGFTAPQAKTAECIALPPVRMAKIIRAAPQLKIYVSLTVMCGLYSAVYAIEFLLSFMQCLLQWFSSETLVH